MNYDFFLAIQVNSDICFIFDTKAFTNLLYKPILQCGIEQKLFTELIFYSILQFGCEICSNISRQEKWWPTFGICLPSLSKMYLLYTQSFKTRKFEVHLVIQNKEHFKKHKQIKENKWWLICFSSIIIKKVCTSLHS